MNITHNAFITQRYLDNVICTTDITVLQTLEFRFPSFSTVSSWSRDTERQIAIQSDLQAGICILYDGNVLCRLKTIPLPFQHWVGALLAFVTSLFVVQLICDTIQFPYNWTVMGLRGKGGMRRTLRAAVCNMLATIIVNYRLCDRFAWFRLLLLDYGLTVRTASVITSGALNHVMSPTPNLHPPCTPSAELPNPNEST
jgi:hypothetical protein